MHRWAPERTVIFMANAKTTAKGPGLRKTTPPQAIASALEILDGVMSPDVGASARRLARYSSDTATRVATQSAALAFALARGGK